MRNRKDIEYILTLVHKYKFTSFLYRKIHPLFRKENRYKIYIGLINLCILIAYKSFDSLDKQRLINSHLRMEAQKDDKLIDLQIKYDSVNTVALNLKRKVAVSNAYEEVIKEKNAIILSKDERIQDLNNNILGLGKHITLLDKDIIRAWQAENAAQLVILSTYGVRLEDFQCEGDRKEICNMCETVKQIEGW